MKHVDYSLIRDVFNFNRNLSKKEIKKKKAERDEKLFVVGDRVKIAKGIFSVFDELSVKKPFDIDTDPSLGLFAIVRSVDEESFKNFNRGHEIKESCFQLQEFPTVTVVLESDPGDDTRSAYPKLCEEFPIPAVDLINYTLLGNHDGNLLFGYTKSRNLPMYNVFKEDVRPDDFTTFALSHCDDEIGRSQMFLQEKENELMRHTALVYTQMINEFEDLNRKFRFLVQYRKMHDF